MNPRGTEDMFQNFTYEKPSAEIITKAQAKIAALLAKVEERQARVTKIREEYEVTDQALVEILTQARGAQRDKMSYTYNSSSAQGLREERSIGAGVVNNLLTENDYIESERKQAKRLGLIVRNLQDRPDETIHVVAAGVERPLRGHCLTEEELEYLGF